MHKVKNVGSHFTLRIDSELFWFSVIFIIVCIFENQFDITDFIPFALIVLCYCLDRIKNKCMQTPIDIDRTNFENIAGKILLLFQPYLE